MHTDVVLSVPIHNPVLAFLLALTIMLVAPLVMTRFRIPSIVGLILAGVIIGPHGLGLLARNSSTILLSTIGLLYIMFLAALELDLAEFRKRRLRSLIFGGLTFAVPFIIGLAACRLLLGLDWLAAVLVASMFSTHTLLTYPIASRLGLSKNEAVTIAVGGTIITDTAVLLALAVISSLSTGEATSEYWIKFAISIACFVFVVLWGFPRIGDWFFRNIEGERSAHFLFVLTMVFLAAFLAQLAGIEAIIGAFLAGLALNALIPHASALMNRIEFIGQSLFIPYFLISVGMLVDLRVIFTGWGAISVAALLTLVALVSKGLAAWIAGKLFRFSPAQSQVLFGLTSAHAAATIAVITVGYDLKLVDENVLNGTVLLILATCLAASFVTERAGRSLAIASADEPMSVPGPSEQILVPIKYAENVEKLIELAILLKQPRSHEAILALRVVKDDAEADDNLLRSRQMLERAVAYGSASDTPVHVLARVDLNVASGISRAVTETRATHILLGWNLKPRVTARLFGSTLEQLLISTHQMILVSQLNAPLNTVKRLLIAVPPNAEVETGFPRWAKTLAQLARNLDASLAYHGTASTRRALEALKPETEVQTSFELLEDWDDFLILTRAIVPTDLLVVIMARPQSVSWSPSQDKVPQRMLRYFQGHNFLLVYPEQPAQAYIPL